ncbi:hypothetical protein WDW37_03160 [Bdellovibrionota bacterium FG-1]
MNTNLPTRLIILSMLTLSPLASADGRRHDARPQGAFMHTPPASSAHPDEVDAANMTAQAMGGLGCARAGEALRRLSNMLLANARFVHSPDSPAQPGELRSVMREEMRRRWREHLQSPVFWQIVWTRLANAYRECNLTCFDDGIAVGQISATGYCSASVSVGGLNGPGFMSQPPLPLCQNETFIGCQTGYNQIAGTYPGCAPFTTDGFTSVFNEFKSQDCHR